MASDRYVIIQDILDIPRDCHINSVIPKSKIIEHAELSKKDKDLFKDYVLQIKLLYNFSKKTIRIAPCENEKRKYNEVQVINVILKEENLEMTNPEKYIINTFKQDSKLERIVDILFRFIKYPQLIVLQYDKNIRLFTSHRTKNPHSPTGYTLDEIISTNWINTTDLDQLDKKLFNNLQLKNLDYTNFYTFYDSIIKALIQYAGETSVGEEVNLPLEEIQEINNQINNLTAEVNRLEKEMDKESQFKERLNLNIQIGNLEIEIEKLKEKLKNNN